MSNSTIQTINLAPVGRHYGSRCQFKINNLLIYGVIQKQKELSCIIVCVCVCVCVCVLSHIQLFLTPRTVACQLLCPSNFLDKNTGAGCHFLLQRILLTQESNLCLLHLLHWQADSFTTTPPRKPTYHSEVHIT